MKSEAEQDLCVVEADRESCTPAVADRVPVEPLIQDARTKRHDNEKRFGQGERVKVLPWDEVIGTLDEDGTLEGLPFMPEMVQYCGKVLRVSRRLERTCEDVHGGMRRIRNVVFLDDLRCEGSAHSGCQKLCCILWKDAWLGKAAEEDPVCHETSETEGWEISSFPFAYAFPEQRYSCQATELFRASEHLSPLDVRSYLRDIKAKTYSPWQMLSLAFHAFIQRTRFHLAGRSHQFLEGDCVKTPTRVLTLQAGEWVVVKSANEIAETLNKEGKNRGLAFTAGMLPYCGRTFRVLRRLEKMIHEPSGKLIRVGDTVILENVTCQGIQSLRGGCPKNNYYFWREIWLKRV